MPTQIAPPAVPDFFILWHPSCKLGETLARRVYSWLRPANGLGPQVFFRSLPAPGKRLPLAVPRIDCAARLRKSPPGARVRQILFVLIDSNMIADAAWRFWLEEIVGADDGDCRVIFPVALDSTAYNVPNDLRLLNFLRPAGLPAGGANPPGSVADIEIVARSLLKQITESLCRLLLTSDASPATAGAPARSKVTVFLSHAKIDGATPAQKVRDYIYSKTQLAAFYDENDIPFGAGFAKVLETELERGNTAALIAVRSAKYATRPWCRQELSIFRRPFPVEENPRMQAQHWRLRPMLVVDALDSGASTIGISEFGNAPIIRWSNDVPEQEEQIVTTVLRDALLAALHDRAARLVRDAADRVALNWVPDPYTLAQIRSLRDESRRFEILYPGRGLTGLDIAVLRHSYPNLTFRSFDQDDPDALIGRPKGRKSMLVGLSISYDRKNLAERGLGLDHLKELVVLLARPLLRRGANIAYAGDWKEREENFTYELLRLINSEQEDQNGDDAADKPATKGDHKSKATPLLMHNHCAWPHYLDVTEEIEAQWINCCRIVRITQTDAGIAPDDEVPESQGRYKTDQVVLNAAITLSGMRRIAMEGWTIDVADSHNETIPPIDARILMGGKMDDYSGWLPGLFEEALLTLEKGKPLYILGGFGGAAKVLADVLLNETDERPAQFTLDWHLSRNPRLARLIGILQARGAPAHIRTTEAALGALFDKLNSGRKNVARTLQTGLSDADTKELLQTVDVRRAVQLVRKGLAANFPPAASAG